MGRTDTSPPLLSIFCPSPNQIKKEGGRRMPPVPNVSRPTTRRKEEEDTKTKIKEQGRPPSPGSPLSPFHLFLQTQVHHPKTVREGP